jgi:hypothetical protein
MVNFLKTKSFNYVTQTSQQSTAACVGSETEMGEEKGITKYCKSVLILEKYKNAHHGNSHGVLQEMPDK